MNEERNGFFQRIKDWARENNTTIEVLMESIGFTKAIYYGWRQGDKLPSASHVYKLSKAMGVSMEWLVAGEEAQGAEKAPGDGFQARIGAALEKLDDFDKETVAESAEALARRRFVPARPLRASGGFVATN